MRVARGGIPGAHRPPRAAVPAPAPAARRPRLQLPAEPRSGTFQINPLRKRGLHRREHPQVDQLARGLPVERQAAAVLREYERTGRGR